MAVDPIYIETEEEIPGVIERLRRSSAEEVPLVFPTRARFGQSRFNFQLLRQYAARLGKRVTIISPDPAIQRLAADHGFPALRGVEQWVPGAAVPAAVGTAWAAPAAAQAPVAPVVPIPVPARPEPREWQPPAAARPPAAASPPSWLQGAALGSAAERIGVRVPEKLAAGVPPGRAVAYAGAALLLVVGLIAMVLYVPSATVTLVAQSKPFSASATVTGAPGKGPVRVRVATVQKQASAQLNATGSKTIPGAPAKGTVTFDATACGPPDVVQVTIQNGTRLRGPGGVEFATSGGDLKFSGSASGPITATQPGAAGNVQPGSFSFENEGNSNGCIQISSQQPTAGGTDPQKKTVVSEADIANARAQLQQQLSKEISDELSKQTQKGEKLNDQVQFDGPQFNTDHKAGDEVSGFSATMILKGEGDYYDPGAVSNAFSAILGQKVPASQQLTGRVTPQYQVTAAPGGQLTFAGKANGFVAPRLDLEALRRRLSGKSRSQAEQILKQQPVQSTDVQQYPLKLPFMPLTGSRIHIRYEVAAAPGSS